MNMQSVSEIQPQGAEPVSPSQLIEKATEMLHSGAAVESLSLLLDAFAFQPDDRITQSLLIEALATTTGYNLPNTLYNTLAEGALTHNHDMNALSDIICRQYENDPLVYEVIQFFETDALDSNENTIPVAALEHVLGNQLFILVATKGIAVSEVFERLIKAIRRHFLFEWFGTATNKTILVDSCPELLTSIAGQCFNTEYIYEEAPEETVLVNRLYSAVQDAPLEADIMDIAILACYKPLWAVLAGNAPAELEALISKAENWQGWAKVIWKTQFLSPCQEMYLKQNIPSYSPISKGQSEALQRQYDAFPYPRWLAGTRARTQQTLAAYLQRQFPDTAPDSLEDEAVNILFAGCGSGEEIIHFASALETNNILAIDLSTASLAFAQRRAHELGVKNAHFGHADIVEFGSVDARFDVIVCQDVLDHMVNPSVGINALKQIAKPETIFFLSTASERSRKAALAGRECIKDKNLMPTYEGFRQFRELVRCLPETHPASKLRHQRQFYSASELHDLVFNSHQHGFTPAELQIFLSEHGLKLIGFDFDEASKRTLYQQCFPEDISMTNLSNWERLDNECPDIFADGMKFWCQLA